MIHNFPIGLLSAEHRAAAVYLLGSYVNTLGEKIYHVGNGVLTGEAGWIDFNKEVEKKLNRRIEELKTL